MMGCYYKKKTINAEHVYLFCRGPALWAGPLGHEYGYRPETHPNVGTGQTKLIEMWALARTNRPKYGIWPDRTNQQLSLTSRKA